MTPILGIPFRLRAISTLAVCFLSLIAVFTASQVHATSPSAREILPIGGQRGTEVPIKITGQRLADVEEILFYNPGIQVKDLKAVSATEVRATLKIATDCRPGIHEFRLRATSGVGSLRVFSVGLLPESSEKEPNNDFTKPQPIAMNATINGVALQEDIDYFVVEAKKGERITAEVEGIRLGQTLFDPYVAILDANRYELATSDDAAFVRQDAVVSIAAPADGKYIIAVRESAYAGNNQSVYRLHVGHFPRSKAIYPSGGKAGSSLKVQWIGNPLGNRETLVSLPKEPTANFLLFDQDALGMAPDGNKFRVTTLDNVLEVEPNNDHKTATIFTAPMAINGIIQEAGDSDSFVFKAKRGQQFHVKVYARSLGSPLDPVMSIARRNGGNLAANDDLGGPDSYLKFSAPGDGEYVVSVRDHLKKGGPDYVYRIELSPIQPILNVSPTPEAQRRGSAVVAISVPRGGRQSVLITGQRVDFGGDLRLKTTTLPEGVKVSSDIMTSNINSIPMLFEAAPDAKIGSVFTTVVGEHVDGKTQIDSRFSHSTTLVYGQNNITFVERITDKFVVAVAKEAPFSIEVVEPKAPLTRNGEMELKVKAKREPGFDAEINLLVPFTPPGVSAARGAKILKGQTEATITVNANSGAPAQTWKLVVDGFTFGRDNPSPLRVSSQMFPLTICQPYVSFAYKPISVEQGKETALAIDVSKLVDFDGEASVVIKGLPNKATAPQTKITKATEELVLPIQTDATTPAGVYKNLFCQVAIIRNGEPILHNLGYATLRVDAPLPSKKPVATATTTPAKATTTAVAKPLSRLEKLREEYRERMKANGNGLGQKPASTVGAGGND